MNYDIFRERILLIVGGRGRQNDNEMGSTRNDRVTGYGGFEYDNHSRSTAEDDSISVLIDGH